MRALLALLFLSLPVSCAQAQEITTVLQLMPREAVIERCSDEGLLAELGCISFLPARDNPDDLWCKIFVVAGLMPWEQDARVEALRPRCFEGQGR